MVCCLSLRRVYLGCLAIPVGVTRFVESDSKNRPQVATLQCLVFVALFAVPVGNHVPIVRGLGRPVAGGDQRVDDLNTGTVRA